MRFLWSPSGFLFGLLKPDAPRQACAQFGRIMALPRFKRFSLFGQLETDASLQACAHFGRIMALPRFKRFSLWSTRDRRIAPGVRSLRPNHGPSPLQAVFFSVDDDK
jgi:hypothetical protein